MSSIFGKDYKLGANTPYVGMLEAQKRRGRVTRATMLDPIEQWMEDANCAGCNPDNFFPEQYSTDVPRKMVQERHVCANCGVQPECADYALRVNATAGLWAGVLIYGDYQWRDKLIAKAKEMDA